MTLFDEAVRDLEAAVRQACVDRAGRRLLRRLGCEEALRAFTRMMVLIRPDLLVAFGDDELELASALERLAGDELRRWARTS